MTASAFPKRCRCGRSYSAEEWAELPGKQVWPADFHEPGWTLEQRDCPCGSSITVPIPNPGSAS